MSKQTNRSKNGRENKGAGSTSDRSTEGSGKAVFLNPHFNDSDRAKLQSLLPEQLNLVAEFLGEHAQDYNLSVKIDHNSGKFNALLFPVGDDNPNKGYILSVRNSDRFLAVFGLAYAHVYKLSGNWRTLVADIEDEWA